MLRVHILYEHSADLCPHGCSYIRLLLPLTHSSNRDAFTVTQGTTTVSANVVIVERTWKLDVSLELAKDLVQQIRAQNASFIYAIDDNLLDLQCETFQPQSLEQAPVVRYFAREADGIIVSTERLKDRMARLNNTIRVVENALDEQLFGATVLHRQHRTAADDGRKLIGFMGTHTHDADLMMVLQALRKVLREDKNSLEFQLIGGIADRATLQAFEGVPFRILELGNNVEYPSFVRWMRANVRWDLAIAPLEDSPFTRCKSDIKFLDYSAMGVAGIYSRVPAYEKTVRHLDTGYLAENTPEAWSEALHLLLANDSLRLELAAKAQQYVFSARVLKQSAHNWRSAILSIVGA